MLASVRVQRPGRRAALALANVDLDDAAFRHVDTIAIDVRDPDRAVDDRDAGYGRGIVKDQPYTAPALNSPDDASAARGAPANPTRDRAVVRRTALIRPWVGIRRSNYSLTYFLTALPMVSPEYRVPSGAATTSSSDPLGSGSGDLPPVIVPVAKRARSSSLARQLPLA